MRTFIINTYATTSPKIDLLKLHKYGLDVVCSTIINALFYSNNIRKGITINIILNGSPDPPKLITIDSNEVKSLGIDEISIASKIQEVLREKETHGMKIEKRSFESLIKTLPKENTFLLNKRSESIDSIKITENPIFILGDASGIQKRTIKLLTRLGVKKVSIGPKMLFSSQCITIIHNILDKRHIG